MQNRGTLFNKEIYGLGLYGLCHFSSFVNFPRERTKPMNEVNWPLIKNEPVEFEK